MKKNIGSFTFEYLGSDEMEFDIFNAKINGQNITLYDLHWFDNIIDIVQKIKQNIWIEDNHAIEISFEEFTFSFCKVDIPLCGWDEDNEVSYDILVRFTTDESNNIATMTTIEELEEFAKWYENIKCS